MTTQSGCRSESPDSLEVQLNSRARVSALIRESDVQSAREEGDGNTLWRSTSSHIDNISRRLSISNNVTELVEWDVHDLWYRYIQASMNINSERPEQDRLVVQILHAREIGVLISKPKGADSIEEAVTRDGKIWHDLPFLVGDLTESVTGFANPKG